MSFFEMYGKEIVSLLVPFIAWALNNLLRGRAKLQVGQPHKFTFIVPQPLLDDQGNQIQPSQTAHTSSFIIRNSGKEKATNLELVFNWEPLCINLWPVRHYESHTEPDKRYVLIFDSLAPDETLGVEVFSINRETPNLITARSAECTAQYIDMFPQPIVGQSMRIFFASLLMLGMASAVYLSIILVQFLVLKTPVGH